MTDTLPISDVIVELPTPYGTFCAHAFERPSGHVYLALVFGDVAGRQRVLTRVHSECLTGDALGSLRCDCGVQLRESLRTIVAAGEGVLIYATGHEGRGIGLMNKLRAYFEQEHGADTVDANHLLGLPADARDYGDAAHVIRALGIASIRLLSNNPTKREGLESYGIEVTEIVGLRTIPHRRNAGYLSTKTVRMGHQLPGPVLDAPATVAADPAMLLGSVRSTGERPAVVVKYAQTLDGRIATRAGDSQWISSSGERAVSHALRAACDAVLVGCDTVVHDDPRLTVRAVAGASPIRVVVDSRLRAPVSSQLFQDDGSTIVLTTAQSDPARRDELRACGVAVEVVASRDGRVDLSAALARLRELSIEVLLVEGGARIITALLRERLVDRLVVSISPIMVGAGLEAVGDLGIDQVCNAVTLAERVVTQVDGDVIIAGTVGAPAAELRGA